MFMISIPRDELPRLSTCGVQVRINGHPTMLRREAGYLCYKDKEGVENRCRIMRETAWPGDLIHFDCKSHGMDHEEHCIITPEGPEVH
jgi:hypothetical protein